jgi:type II secretory pathway component PulJ
MELVIALLITGMIAAMGAAAFNSVLDNRATAKVATNAVTSAAATRALLERRRAAAIGDDAQSQ